MAKCHLRIELPDTLDFVEPGGELDVIVHVDCDSRTKCSGLTLTRFWRTHGKGNRDIGGKRVVELFRGEWEPGSYAYPAKMPFPSRPLSYHGKAINIDWYVTAAADVPFAFDPSAEEMVLLADASPPREYVAPSVWAPKPVAITANLHGCMIPSIVGFGTAAVALTMGHPIVGGVVALASAGFLIGSLRAGAAVKAVGHVAFEAYPRDVAPGERLHAVVELEPESSLQLEHIKLTLTATEKATSGSGSDETTHTEQAFRIEKVLAKSLQLSAGERFDDEVEFELPVTAPATFEASDNEIATTLILAIQPSGKPELTHTETLQVVGPGQRA